MGNSTKCSQKMAILENTLILSVALDSSTVFHRREDNGTIGKSIKSKRRSVKEKAVEAMRDHGVDISSYVPNTVDEIISSLPSSLGQISSGHNLNTADSVFPTNRSTSEDIGVLDKLIVLCSCGDEMKYKLARCSKSVEEWSIDAPTKAAKSGEGDAAYSRVSDEIRNEVNILMSSLIGGAEMIFQE